MAEHYSIVIIAKGADKSGYMHLRNRLASWLMEHYGVKAHYHTAPPSLVIDDLAVDVDKPIKHVKAAISTQIEEHIKKWPKKKYDIEFNTLPSTPIISGDDQKDSVQAYKAVIAQLKAKLDIVEEENKIYEDYSGDLEKKLTSRDQLITGLQEQVTELDGELQKYLTKKHLQKDYDIMVSEKQRLQKGLISIKHSIDDILRGKQVEHELARNKQPTNLDHAIEGIKKGYDDISSIYKYFIEELNMGSMTRAHVTVILATGKKKGKLINPQRGKWMMKNSHQNS